MAHSNNSLLSSYDLEIIYSAAKSYLSNLCGKSITFLTLNDDGEIEAFKNVYFKADNFAHLIGITPKGNRNCEMLFDDCLNNSLISSSYKLTHRIRTVRLKLAVINNLTNISCDCMEIGKLKDTCDDVVKFRIPKISNSEAIINTTNTAVLSLGRDGDIVFPQSALNINFDEAVDKNSRRSILCTIVKNQFGLYSLGMIKNNMSRSQIQAVYKYIKDMKTENNSVQ